jgi:hypothetical protein
MFDLFPLIDIIGDKKIITQQIDDGYETSVYALTRDGAMGLWLERHRINNAEHAIKQHQQCVEDAGPKKNHPCRCGSLNTRYNSISDIWECPSCIQDRL